MLPSISQVFDLLPWYFWLTSGIQIALLVLVFSLPGDQKRLTPITIFFAFLVTHATIGTIAAFFAVGGTTKSISTLAPFLAEASLVIGVGVASIMIGYLLTSRRIGYRAWRRMSRRITPLRPDSVAARCGFMAVIGMVIVTVFLLIFGVPAFDANIGTARYLNYFSSENTMWPFLLNRAKELIQLSVSFLAIGIITRKMSALYWGVMIPAFATLTLTAHRTPIVMTFLFVALAMLVMRRLKALAFTGMLALVLYLVSAAFFLFSARDSTEFSIESGLRAVGFGLPEVRDLAWVLSSRPDYLEGLTYVVAFLPIPSWATEFTNSYRIRTVTLQAAGFGLDSDAGGFRLTFGGENYVNFGIAGVIALGLLYGVGCRVFSNFFGWMDAARLTRNPLFSCACVSFWLLYSFLFYLSGSGIAGPIKSEVFFVAILIYTARRRSVRWVTEPLSLHRMTTERSESVSASSRLARPRV